MQETRLCAVALPFTRIPYQTNPARRRRSSHRHRTSRSSSGRSYLPSLVRACTTGPSYRIRVKGLSFWPRASARSSSIIPLIKRESTACSRDGPASFGVATYPDFVLLLHVARTGRSEPPNPAKRQHPMSKPQVLSIDGYCTQYCTGCWSYSRTFLATDQEGGLSVLKGGIPSIYSCRDVQDGVPGNMC